MSESRAIGPERCAMISPHGAGRFVRGSRDIDNLLCQGWTIVPNDFRNHLLESRFVDDAIDVDYTIVQPLQIGDGQKALPEGQKALEIGKEETRATIGLDPVKTETGKRPRIKRK